MVFVVVDNNKSDLELLSHRLTATVPACKVQPFTDPLLSAKYICNNPVDVVFLMDTMYPVNGFQLMKVLRKNVPKLAIVMLSDGELNRVNAFQAGSTDYVQKPIPAEQLEGVIKQIVKPMRRNNKLESEVHNTANENNLSPDTGVLSDDEMNYAAAADNTTPPVVHCPKCGSANNQTIVIPSYSGYRCNNCCHFWQ